MIKVALIAGGDLESMPQDFDYYIGIDRGGLALLESGIPMVMAVGDFDSVSESELERIKESAAQVILAPKDKNDTDTELALKVALERWPNAKFSVYGAFGGRLDHLLANIFLPSHPDLAPYMTQICLLDGQNVVEYRPAGHHEIGPWSGMTYVSFMTSDDAELNIEGAKYTLTADNFFKKKIYSSNEFTDKLIEVSLDRGYLIIIHSKDRI